MESALCGYVMWQSFIQICHVGSSERAVCSRLCSHVRFCCKRRPDGQRPLQRQPVRTIRFVTFLRRAALGASRRRYYGWRYSLLAVSWNLWVYTMMGFCCQSLLLHRRSNSCMFPYKGLIRVLSGIETYHIQGGNPCRRKKLRTLRNKIEWQLQRNCMGQIWNLCWSSGYAVSWCYECGIILVMIIRHIHCYKSQTDKLSRRLTSITLKPNHIQKT